MRVSCSDLFLASRRNPLTVEENEANMKRVEVSHGQLVSSDLFKPWFPTRPRASLIAQLVKNPPAMQGTLVHFLGKEDPLEKG